MPLMTLLQRIDGDDATDVKHKHKQLATSEEESEAEVSFGVRR